MRAIAQLMLLGCPPGPLLRCDNPDELLAVQVLARQADELLDEQHERAAAHIAVKISELF